MSIDIRKHFAMIRLKRLATLMTGLVTMSIVSAQGTIEITFDGKSADVSIPADVEGVTATKNGANVTIRSATTTTEYTYRVSGQSPDGSLTINGDYKLTLQLAGLPLTNAHGGAAIDVECGKRIAVELVEGTVNTLEDSQFGAQKAALYFKGHPEFEGGGTLNVTGHLKHAICAKEYMELKSSTGTINVLGAPSDGLHCGKGKVANEHNYFLMKGGNTKILIPEFSWWYYNRVASECDGTFEMYPLHEQDDTFAYDVDEVIEYTNRVHPRMLLLASPNNPTGNSLTSEEIGRIMESIPEDTMVLIDEAYASFISSDTDYIAPLVNKYSNLIISRTLSKFYGLPGLRCGFGFIGKGHEQFESYVNKYLGYNRFSEAVALAALDSDEHYRRVADDMEWGRQLYKRCLGQLPGFKVYKSVANFILIKYPEAKKVALQQALASESYKIKFMTDKGLESCVRITLGRKEQTQAVCDIILKVCTE